MSAATPVPSAALLEQIQALHPGWTREQVKEQAIAEVRRRRQEAPA
jgi:hypothetical protein